MSLIRQVYGSLRWKKTDEFCASSLNISLEKNKEIKRQILQTRDLVQNEVESSIVDLAGKRMPDLINDKQIKDLYNSDLEDLLVGDLLNMNTFLGQTTKGTAVDNDLRAEEAYKQAFDSLYWSIGFIKQFCNQLQVVYLPGNHDRLSSYHMAHALSKCFSGEGSIVFDVEYAERKVITYGDNFFAFEHGDVTTKNTALVYATEFPQQWGSTIYRTCYTGHWHRKKVVEYVSENEVHGFTLKQLPSLSKTDYWHYHNKYTGSKRQAIMEIHDFTSGKVSEFTFSA